MHCDNTCILIKNKYIPLNKRGNNLTVPKLTSTLPKHIKDLGRRINDKPIITVADITPSDSRLYIVGVLNPTCININGNLKLIVRIDEAPIQQYNILQDSVGDTCTINVAYIDVENNNKLEICQATVNKDYDPYKVSVLPPYVRNEFRKSNIELLLSFVSHLRFAEFDGYKYIIEPTPCIFPSDYYSQFGCEDPRATTIEGKHYITYTSIGRYGGTSWLAHIAGDNSISNKYMLLGPDHKHSALFPKRVNGQYAMLTRPLTRSTVSWEGIWLTLSYDLIHWGAPCPILHPRHNKWDSIRVGPASSPILLDDGWLLFYYGVDSEYCYHLGAALLDANNIANVIRRAEYPVLSPVLEWEQNGRRADTIFPCGSQLLSDGENIRIYYGAADVHIGAADINIRALINSMTLQ